MRLLAFIAALFLSVGAASAADHWHRAPGGGQDLTEPDGAVVGMVRKDKAGWLALVIHERGGEGFDDAGYHRTQAEAKAVVVSAMHAEDVKEEE